MDVRVEDLLESRFAVGEKEVHSFALQIRSAQCTRHEVRNTEKGHAEIFIEIVQVRNVRLGDDKSVADRDWLNVHEGQHALVLVDKARLCPAGDDLAELAVVSCLGA